MKEERGKRKDGRWGWEEGRGKMEVESCVWNKDFRNKDEI